MPSPTGPLHLGNLRTALLAWLSARSSGRRFVVRVDDLDPVCADPAVARAQLADLAALGLDWDGPVERVTDRRARHEAVLASLRADGAVYECFCTRREIRDAVAAPHGPVQGYPGTCRDLGPAARRARAAQGRPAAWRLRADPGPVRIVDDLHGELVGVADDVVVRRNDGVPAYNLVVVVDDHDDGVDQVVRGDDLLDVTPAQAHLGDRLGFARPRWAHVPLVLGPDGTRLAKRHGAVTMGDLAGQGTGAGEILALLAAASGLAEPGEPVTAPDLVDRFDVARLERRPWTIDPAIVTGPPATTT